MNHFGVAFILAHVWEKYCIMKGRRCLKLCMMCRKLNATSAKVEIAPLPKDRIIETPAFETSNADFAGPVYYKTSEGIGKTYIVVFTFAVTRAIDLELITNLNTQTFILAHRRFFSRRRFCKAI